MRQRLNKKVLKLERKQQWLWETSSYTKVVHLQTKSHSKRRRNTCNLRVGKACLIFMVDNARGGMDQKKLFEGLLDLIVTIGFPRTIPSMERSKKKYYPGWGADATIQNFYHSTDESTSELKFFRYPRERALRDAKSLGRPESLPLRWKKYRLGRNFLLF